MGSTVVNYAWMDMPSCLFTNKPWITFELQVLRKLWFVN